MSSSSLSDLLVVLKSNWNKSQDPNVVAAAAKLDSCLQEEDKDKDKREKIRTGRDEQLKDVLGDLKYSPFQSCLSKLSDEPLQWRPFPVPETSHTKNEKEAEEENEDSLEQPRTNNNTTIRICHLVTSSAEEETKESKDEEEEDVGKGLAVSDHFTLSLMILPANAEVPQHAEDAEVILCVVSGGGGGARMGASGEEMEGVGDDDLRHFPSAVPKVIQSGPDSPLLLLYARFGCISPTTSSFWFCRAQDDNPYFDDTRHIQDVLTYYDRMAKSYETVMRGWGWCMPDIASDALIKHGMPLLKDLMKEGEKRQQEQLRVLDLGTGCGLTGLALKKRGFADLTGVDFSQPMLDEARRRGCYGELVKADLMKPLPFEEGSFDLVVSTGVLTFLDSSVLTDWIRVTRPGGLLVFTNKTTIWPQFEPEQERLEKDLNLWTRQFVSEPLVNLPSLQEEKKKVHSELAKVYIYRKN